MSWFYWIIYTIRAHKNKKVYNQLANFINDDKYYTGIASCLGDSEVFDNDSICVYDLNKNKVDSQFEYFATFTKGGETIYGFDFLLSRYCAFIFDGGHHEIFSEESIINQLRVKKEKREKYKTNNNVDCFIWLYDSEYRIIDTYFNERNYNGSYKSFMNDLITLKFNKIYFCKYEFYKQNYNMNELFIFDLESKNLIKKII